MAFGEAKAPTVMLVCWVLVMMMISMVEAQSNPPPKPSFPYFVSSVEIHTNSFGVESSFNATFLTDTEQQATAVYAYCSSARCCC